MKLGFLCVDIPLSKIEYAHLFLAYALFLLITVAGILTPAFKKNILGADRLIRFESAPFFFVSMESTASYQLCNFSELCNVCLFLYISEGFKEHHW